MFGRLNGIVFVLLLFFTALLGAIFILFPFIPLAYFAPRLWRQIADRSIGYWLTFPASLVQLFGSRFHVTGDTVHRDEPALIIMNHRTRLDWLFLWNALYKMDPWLLTTEKISLKAALKSIPGAGWAMSCGAFLFLERNFESDKKHIKDMIDYYATSGRCYQVLLFPEGTDRGKRAIAIDDAFADKNGLKRYSQVLHPRITGFNYITHLMTERTFLSAVYDVTVAYPDTLVSSEMDLLKNGQFPKNIHFDVKRYDIASLPESEDEKSEWLKDLWEEKEKKLIRFYEETGKLEPSGEGFVWPVETRGFGYYAAFLFWCVSSLYWMYVIYMYSIVKVYTAISLAFYVYAHRYHGGVDRLFVKWENASRRKDV